MNTRVEEYSVWLLPVADELSVLQSHIQRLATRYAKPYFVPHLTIQGDIARPLASLQEHIKTLAQNIAPQRWPISGIATTDFYFRCLFLRYECSPVFDALQSSLRQLTSTDDGMSLFPHISLAYGLSEPQRTETRFELKQNINSTTTRFDRIAIVRSSKNIAIEDWEIVDTYALQSDTHE